MMTALIAQTLSGYTLVHWLIVAMVVAGAIGIVYVVARQAGIVIPQFIVTIAWIVLAVVVGAVAIKFIASLM